MQQNALRYRDIRLCCDVTDVNTVTRAMVIGKRIYCKHGVTLGRVTWSYVGNSSQISPGSGWQTTSGSGTETQLIMHPTNHFPHPPRFRKWLTIAF